VEQTNFAIKRIIMKRIILINGIIAGVIAGGVLTICILLNIANPEFKGSMLIGYASMILAFSLIFIGVKKYRDNENGGVISFGKAFKIGLLIALIGSTIYVLSWLILYHTMVPDYMEKYVAAEIKVMKEKGTPETEIQETMKKMESMQEMYKNPFFMILFTYLEILPVGLLVSLIAALILKRKSNLSPSAT
jgi:hypothetical protein